MVPMAAVDWAAAGAAKAVVAASAARVRKVRMSLGSPHLLNPAKLWGKDKTTLEVFSSRGR
jgi:hypothetical protein